jgi:hypothetical protein
VATGTTAAPEQAREALRETVREVLAVPLHAFPRLERDLYAGVEQFLSSVGFAGDWNWKRIKAGEDLEASSEDCKPVGAGSPSAPAATHKIQLKSGTASTGTKWAVVVGAALLPAVRAPVVARRSLRASPAAAT